VTGQVTEALDAYRYSDAARTLYDFAWNEFCSFFVEMLKNRLLDDARRIVAQRLLAHTLDALLRLLHPIIPFITEEVWQLLGRAAPERGLEPQKASDTIMKAPWPEADASRQDKEIEAQFAEFQAVLGALREIRSRQNIPPKSSIEFSVRCNEATAKLLQPMEPYFASMANATAVAWGEHAEPPANNATVHMSGADVFVDLTGFIDVDAEKARLEKRVREVLGQIQAKEKKLANANFVERAPADVVQRERDSLAQLKVELASVQQTLDNLRGSSE
jgi:valyl-tRNA synthetase